MAMWGADLAYPGHRAGWGRASDRSGLAVRVRATAHAFAAPALHVKAIVKKSNRAPEAKVHVLYRFIITRPCQRR